MPYELIIITAICAYIFSEQLTQPGMILNLAYLLADERLPGYIHKPLITCFKCVAGQWCMWAYVFNNFDSFNIFHCIASPLIGIAVALVFHKLTNHE